MTTSMTEGEFRKQPGEVGEPYPTAVNTDRELWREREGDYYAPSIHVTQGGAIAINVGGFVIVKPVREWHQLAIPASLRDRDSIQDLVAERIAVARELMGVARCGCPGRGSRSRPGTTNSRHQPRMKLRNDDAPVKGRAVKEAG